ncbi:hypothetical protein PVAND_015330 [Polypedilum vanderplanki]|uniref:Uncharacterized protein n=1 Tax=Polypedilum vanderplanki TaxID=319348 RepID=A0A9J6BCS6_POLVA|nr:hypothetical protein PVAND_015330 [Polypedilum vanderplanki]
MINTLIILLLISIAEIVKSQSNASCEVFYKYKCANKYYHYNLDNEPVEYGISAGQYEPGKEAYVGIAVFEHLTLIGNRIQLDPPGFLYRNSLGYGEIFNDSKQIWYLANNKDHSYEWVPSQNGNFEPFAINYNGDAPAFFGRIKRNGNVILGNVALYTGEMYYIDENGIRQTTTSGYEVLTCKSSKNETEIPPPSFDKLPNYDIGCINNWQLYKNDDAPVKYGISAGEFDCNNTAYIGKATPFSLTFPGRVQVINNTGIYVLSQKKEVLINDNTSFYLANNLNYTYYWVDFEGTVPQNSVFSRSSNGFFFAVTRVKRNGYVRIGYTVPPFGTFPNEDGTNDESDSNFEVLVCDPWPKYQCAQNWKKFDVNNTNVGIKVDGFDVKNFNGNSSFYIGRSCDYGLGSIQLSPPSAAGLYYADDLLGNLVFDNSNKTEYLVKNSSYTYKWQPSRDGKKVANALELHKEGRRPFYIAKTRINGNVVIGKVRPGDGLFFINPTTGKQESTGSYEVLTCTSPDPSNGEYEEESDEEWFTEHWCPIGMKWCNEREKCIKLEKHKHF